MVASRFDLRTALAGTRTLAFGIAANPLLRTHQSPLITFSSLSIFAQVSVSVTVRLKTGCPGVRILDRRRSSPAARTGSGCPARRSARLGSTLAAASATSSDFGIQVGLVVAALRARRPGRACVNRWSYSRTSAVDGVLRPRPSGSCPSPCGRRARCRRASPGRRCSAARSTSPVVASFTTLVHVTK